MCRSESVSIPRVSIAQRNERRNDWRRTVAPPPRWSATLAAARDEAALAVRLYNDASETRAFEGFVVHMHLAWLYLLHARLIRDGIDYRYRDRHNPRRFEKVDGEYKRWELARCLKHRWPDNSNPVRNNIEFFIGLRNRIEHRHARSDVNLAIAVSGHAQAFLLNFEDEISTTFGSKYGMAAILRFPVFIGTFTAEGEETLRRLRDKLPKDLKRFIGDFHAGLPEEVSRDSHFELRLRDVLERVASDPDALAIQFTRWDDMTEEEKSAVLEMGKRGQTIIREQKRAIVGYGLFKPREAERRVAAVLPFTFNNHHFKQPWSRKQIRPPGYPNPEQTDEKYCIYDALSRSYGYTEAWVEWLVRHCSSEEGFKEVTGRKPQPKTVSGTEEPATEED